MAERITLPLWEPIPADLACDTFSYDPDSGLVYWRKTGKGRHAKRGGLAGFKKGGEGYMRVKLRGKLISLHRLAWCLHHGSWPSGLIDHINGDPSDNRIINLRLADKRLNAENQRRARSDNTTGVFGVQAAGARFRSQIRTGGATTYLGVFDSKEEAQAAYLNAKRALHKGCSI